MKPCDGLLLYKSKWFKSKFINGAIALEGNDLLGSLAITIAYHRSLTYK